MKRLVAAASAVVLSFGAYAGVQAAALPTMSPETQSIVTVTSKDGFYTSSLVNDSITKEAASLRSVIYAPSSLAVGGASESQAFEVTSKSGKGLASDVFLRLSTDTNSKDALYDATKLLKTYSLVIKSSDGKTVYSSATANPQIVKNGASEYVLDIYLGRFNNGDNTDKNAYTLNVSIPKGLAAADIKNLKKVNWQVVSDPVEAGSTEAPIISTPAPTAAAVPAESSKPSAETGNLSEAVPSSAPTASPAATAAPTATAAVTAAPTATPDPAISLDESKKRVVGTGTGEIKPGSYTVKAKDKEAVVKIFGSDDKLKQEISLTEAKPTQEITLVAGDRIENNGGITMTENRTATATPKATAKVTATTAPKTTTTAKTTTATAKPNATATPKPSTAKTNPKTEDPAPIAGASALAIFALGMAAYPFIEKKRENNR